MRGVRFGAWYGLRGSVVFLAAIAAVSFSTSQQAAAGHHRVRTLWIHQAARAPSYSPPTAAIVIDGNDGSILSASNADASRHPASLTKIMTLYLLFERLDAGKIKLDSRLKVSEHASEQAPTKLGLKPGQTIAVEDAIKAVVTKSANDAAVTIAENLGGDEETYAKLMTQKARALGMAHTTYVNVSGLPDDDQVTTARDEALLGRDIQERFPQYYKYFSTREFVYRGREMRNHNHLLGVVGGVDGIKTGYTRASGFNLVTSVHRDGRYIVAVVLGGRSASERDARMRDLIGAHIKEASVKQAGPAVAEKLDARRVPQPIAFATAPLASRAAPPPAAAPTQSTVGSSDPIQPVMVKTVSYRTAPAQPGALSPLPNLVPVVTSPPQPQPAAVSAPQPIAAIPVRAPGAPKSETPRTIIVSSAEPAAIAPAARIEPAKIEPAKTEAAKVEAAKTELAKAMTPPSPAHARTRGGWIIQIGAYDGEDEAKQHLSAAQLKMPTALASADPFTQRVQKGDKALYRARFAGFDRAMAEAACKQLKRSDIACMAVKD
ncbi:MAG TPA: serine hydrolase [Xanthobacteraceae bacterium]|nr:serine hydrolase [Xanthobacteraceae bacterium]